MKGSYILVIQIKNLSEIRIGKLGRIKFEPGYYAYVGSAMNSLETRIARHLRKNNKKLWWHVDYLLANESVEVVDVLIRESDKKEECSIARELAERFEVIRGFGSSDCKCEGHLFYLGKIKAEISVSQSLKSNPSSLAWFTALSHSSSFRGLLISLYSWAFHSDLY